MFPECNADDFIFLAASEYIDRKGFDHLFEAYATAFTSEDKVGVLNLPLYKVLLFKILVFKVALFKVLLLF